MNRHERLNALIELIMARQSVHVDEIVTELGVSPATARRDLDILAQQQLITRTRGGASGAPASENLAAYSGFDLSNPITDWVVKNGFGLDVRGEFRLVVGR